LYFAPNNKVAKKGSESKNLPFILYSFTHFNFQAFAYAIRFGFCFITFHAEILYSTREFDVVLFRTTVFAITNIIEIFSFSHMNLWHAHNIFWLIYSSAAKLEISRPGVKIICGQKRRRSAVISAQLGQQICFLTGGLRHSSY